MMGGVRDGCRQGQFRLLKYLSLKGPTKNPLRVGMNIYELAISIREKTHVASQHQ